MAYEAVREALASGELPPGKRLTVRALSKLLDIGFTPAREALNRLAAEAYIERDTSRGLRVPFLTEERYGELVTIRLQLEPLAAVTALPHVTAATIRHLETTQGRLLEARSQHDYRQVLACNRDFHFTLYRLCNMPTLVAILDSLWLQTGPMLHLLHPARTDQWRGGVNHQAILDALKENDADLLKAAIRRDLQEGSEQLCQALRSRLAQDEAPQAAVQP